MIVSFAGSRTCRLFFFLFRGGRDKLVGTERQRQMYRQFEDTSCDATKIARETYEIVREHDESRAQLTARLCQKPVEVVVCVGRADHPSPDLPITSV